MQIPNENSGPDNFENSDPDSSENAVPDYFESFDPDSSESSVLVNLEGHFGYHAALSDLLGGNHFWAYHQNSDSLEGNMYCSQSGPHHFPNFSRAC